MDFLTPVENKKRQSPHDGGDSQNDRETKRHCTPTRKPPFAHIDFSSVDRVESEKMPEIPNADTIPRDGLRRSLALALQHVGFDSASAEAMESFTATVETYMTTFIEHLKSTAEASRRAQPTPVDFATILQHNNIPLSSLKPHLKNPVAKEKLEVEYSDPIPIPKNANYFGLPAMDFLGPELDGDSERINKTYIPKNFPPFPSKHTFMYTEAEGPQPDLEKRRAQAAAEARKSEMALRRMEKATKARRQKELNQLAQRNELTRERHHLWENLMKEYIPNSGSSENSREIADHSVIVDYNAQFHRKQASRESRGRTQYK